MIVKKQFWVSDVEALYVITGILLFLGLLNVYSASFIMAENTFSTPYFFLKKQVINIALGIAFFAFFVNVDYRRWKRLIIGAVLLTIVTLGLVLVAGTVVNGSRRWLSLGFFQVQPSEFAKLFGIMLEASYLSMMVKSKKRPNFFHVPLGVIALMAFLVEREPDMGTAMIILCVPLIMLAISGLAVDTILKTAVAIFSAGALMCWSHPYRLKRVLSFWDPWASAQTDGYQLVQSLSAIGSGEIFGMGFGTGVSKYEYLPEAHTDFAFAIFCQEHGFVGALFVIILFIMFTHYAINIVNRTQDFYGRILALGVVLLIVGQAIINLLMVGGMFPVVGVPLPFISYGGTSLFVTLSAVGLLLNIGRHADVEERRRKRKAAEAQGENPPPPEETNKRPNLRLVKS